MSYLVLILTSWFYICCIDICLILWTLHFTGIILIKCVFSSTLGWDLTHVEDQSYWTILDIITVRALSDPVGLRSGQPPDSVS